MLYIDTIDNAVSMHTVFTNLIGFLNHTRYISYVFPILLVAIVQYQSDFLSLKIKSILEILSNYWSLLPTPYTFLSFIDFKNYLDQMTLCVLKTVVGCLVCFWNQRLPHFCLYVLWGRTTDRACSGEERGTDPLEELCVDGGGETIVKFES